MAKKFIIAGGGTGGHIFPAIAIANALKVLQPSAEFLFVGAKGKMEMEKVPQAGFKIIGITIAGFDRASLIKNILLPYKLVRSFLETKKIFKNFTPDAVIGVGGYSSFPVLKYAQLKNIPSFIHESNSFAGKSNQLLAKKATRIFVSMPGMEKFFPANKIVVSGNPIRQSIAHLSISREAALAFFNLNPNKTTILAMGGSLGAKSINHAIAKNIKAFELNDLQLIWQTGKTTADQFIKVASGQLNIWAGAFINDIDKAYAAADIVISRSGAMAVTELCVTGKPTVFVPFPLAAEDHQTHNAMSLVNKQAALIVTDANASNDLVDTVIQLANNKLLQAQFTENAKALAITNADTIIANEILSLI